MHWPMQCIYPDLNFRSDTDPDLARRTRWAFLEACSENGHIVITSHFPLPSLAGRFLFLSSPERQLATSLA